MKEIMQVVIDKSSLSTDDGIDDYFSNKAKKEGKNFMEVESVEFQDNVLSLFFYTDKKTAVIGLNFISVCKRIFIANNTVIPNITIAAGSATD